MIQPGTNYDAEQQPEPCGTDAELPAKVRVDITHDAGHIEEKHVDCEYAEWEEWSACQFTCGGGDSVRTRSVKQEALGTGLACEEPDKETRRCAKNVCPIDCVWNEWGAWSECSATCGAGTKTQRRSAVQAQYGGAPCVGDDLLSGDCTLGECPKDCLWNEWSEWGGCSKTCGEGHEKRFRQFTPGNSAGKPCTGEAAISRTCSQNDCPVDCLASDWSAWEGCTATCGKGFTTRKRHITQSMAYGGSPCQQTSETIPCIDLPACTATATVECAWDDWNAWSVCSTTCGEGVKQRTRSEATVEGSVTCAGEKFQELPCSSPACPQDCQASDWSTWSKCSVSCGIGVIERNRVLTAARFGGQECPGGNSSHEKRRCSQGFCPVDCEYADWQEWTLCSASCGEGHSTRMRLVKTQAAEGGRSCPSNDEQNRDCNDRSCPGNCVWGTWREWNTCSKSCGAGKQTRERAVEIQATHQGKACLGRAIEEQTCQVEECREDCKLLDWGRWSSCSSSCGSGTRSRTRGSIPPQNGGVECLSELNETGPCSGLPLCPADCVWGLWREWSACSASCGQALQKRSRTRESYEKSGGKACDGNEDDERTCTVPSCPVDCKVHDWSPWSKCSATCGNGTRTRAKTFTEPLHGGKPCPCNSTESQSEHCTNGLCTTDCVWKQWGDWSPCSRTCGGGYASRLRSEEIPAINGGKFCDGSSKEETVCNATACPLDCALSEWSEWTNCTRTCGGGSRKRVRSTVQQPMFGGEDCVGPFQAKESCAEQFCPLDCAWSTWTLWSVCTQTCDSGVTARYRRKASQGLYGGVPCIGNANEQKSCNTMGCPRDCEWGPWAQWTPCSKTCGGGTIHRSREISVKSKNGGNQCLGSPQQGAECNMQSCATDCVWTDWTEWNACPVSCDGGFRTKTRFVEVEAEDGGRPCGGNTTLKDACNADPCPFDCTLLDWSDWEACSVSCGEGIRSRARVKKSERNGGKPCDEPLAEVVACQNKENVNSCPVTTATTTVIIEEKHVGQKHVPEPCNKDAHPKGPTSLKKEPDANEPCTKEALQATLDAYGSFSTGNINSVVDKLMKAKTSMGTEDASGKHRGRTVADVMGDLRLYTTDPHVFVTDLLVKKSIKQGLAKITGVSEEYMKVDVSLVAAVLTSEIEQKLKGNVNINYTISIHENDNVGDTQSLTDRLMPTNSDKVTHQLEKSLHENAISRFTLQAVSLSMKIIGEDGDAASGSPPGH